MTDEEQREPSREEAIARWRERRQQEPKGEPLQSKNLGDIIGETFQVYGRGFLKLMAIVIIVEAIVYVLAFLWAIPTINPDGGVRSSVGLVVGAVVVAILSGILYLWMQGALIHLISMLNLQLKGNVSSAMLTAWKRLLAMIGAFIVLGLIFGIVFVVIFFLMWIPFLNIILMIILIPVGVYFSVRLAFIMQAVIVEDAGPMEAISRSFELVEGYWWRTFGILIVIGIIAGVIGLALNFILFFIPIAGPIIASIISTPIAIIGYTLLYYDLRSRQERCSIEQAAAELGINIHQQTDS